MVDIVSEDNRNLVVAQRVHPYELMDPHYNFVLRNGNGLGMLVPQLHIDQSDFWRGCHEEQLGPGTQTDQDIAENEDAALPHGTRTKKSEYVNRIWVRGRLRS